MKFLRRWKTQILLFFAVVGPGFITANVDNDAGGIYTYSSAGAQFGHLLLWTMIPVTLALIVVQEMCARRGAVTGKGLSDLIREEFGFRATFFTMLVFGMADLGNIAAEFAGIASGLGIFGSAGTSPFQSAHCWFGRSLCSASTSQLSGCCSCSLSSISDMRVRRSWRIPTGFPYCAKPLFQNG